MNKCVNLYIVLLLILGSESVYSEAVQSDSLQYDDSELYERQYENLNERYNGDEFIYERRIESSGWWTRFKQWFSDFLKDLFNFENRTQAEEAADLAIEILGVILFLLVAYFIAKAILNKEGQWVFGKSAEKSIIPVTDLASDIDSVDFRNLISHAEQDNNFRLAIRYYYLWLLKVLGNKGIIHYDVEKTNSDYRQEIEEGPIRNAFDYTSYLYNYIWYGEFDVSEKQFRSAKTAFNRIISDLTS